MRRLPNMLLLAVALAAVTCCHVVVGAPVITPGVNIDPTNPAGCPTLQNLTDLGAAAVRIEFKDNTTSSPTPSAAALAFYSSVVQRYPGVQVLFILDYATLPGVPATKPGDAWSAYVTNFAGRAAAIAKHFGSAVHSFEVWNEEDLAPQPGYDPSVPAAAYAQLLAATYKAVKAAAPSVSVLVGGLASGDPSYVANVAKAAGGTLPADGVGVHPYGQRPTPDWPSATWGFGVMTDLLQRYAAASGLLPIVITEVGTNDVNVEPVFPQHTFDALQAAVSSTRTTRCYWFCWSDGMVAPFGLVTAQGVAKPSWSSFNAYAVPSASG